MRKEYNSKGYSLALYGGGGEFTDFVYKPNPALLHDFVYHTESTASVALYSGAKSKTDEKFKKPTKKEEKKYYEEIKATKRKQKFTLTQAPSFLERLCHLYNL